MLTCLAARHGVGSSALASAHSVIGRENPFYADAQHASQRQRRRPVESGTAANQACGLLLEVLLHTQALPGKLVQTPAEDAVGFGILRIVAATHQCFFDLRAVSFDFWELGVRDVQANDPSLSFVPQLLGAAAREDQVQRCGVARCEQGVECGQVERTASPAPLLDVVRLEQLRRELHRIRAQALLRMRFAQRFEQLACDRC